MDSLYIQNLAQNFAFLSFMIGMIFAWASLVFISKKFILKIENAANIIGCLTLAGLLTERWIEAHYFPISN